MKNRRNQTQAIRFLVGTRRTARRRRYPQNRQVLRPCFRPLGTAVRGGSFGLSIPAAPPAAAAGAGTTLTLVPVFRNTGFRVNVGLTEVTGQEAAAEIVVKDGHGSVRAVFPETVPAGGLLQVNDVYAAVNLPPDAADRFEIRVVSGAGRVVPFATPVDDPPNDGAFSGEEC